MKPITEQEAATKACPWARAPIAAPTTGPDFVGGNRCLSPRDERPGSHVHRSCRCIGSSCIAWEEAVPAVAEEVLGQEVFGDEPGPDETRGGTWRLEDDGHLADGEVVLGPPPAGVERYRYYVCETHAAKPARGVCTNLGGS